MQTNPYAWAFIEYLFTALPVLIANLTGVILSIVFRRRIGKAAIYSAIAFLLFMSVIVISIGYSAWLNFYVRPKYGTGLSIVSSIALLETLARILLETLAFVPLFIALFAKRNVPTQQEPPLPTEFIS